MNKAIRSKLAVAAVALGMFGAVQVAEAQTDLSISVGVPAQPVPPTAWPVQPAYVPQAPNPAAPTIYVTPGYGFGSPWEQQRAWQDAQWREQQWREQQWREHAWREQRWREHEWREHERREREWRESHGWRR